MKCRLCFLEITAFSDIEIRYHAECLQLEERRRVCRVSRDLCICGHEERTHELPNTDGYPRKCTRPDNDSTYSCSCKEYAFKSIARPRIYGSDSFPINTAPSTSAVRRGDSDAGVPPVPGRRKIDL